jgi:O-antigen ligase
VLAHIFVWLFVFAVPWQDMLVFTGLGTISKLLGIGALAATVLHVIFRGKLRQFTPFHFVVLAYLFWVLLSVYWATALPESVLRNVGTYIQIFLMMWVVWEEAATPARFTSLLQAYVLGAYVAAGSTIYNYAKGAVLANAYNRFAASGFDPNDLGMLLALALPMAWYIASSTSSAFWRWLNRAYFVVGTVAILLTGSRGALLATIMALSVIPWTLTQLRRSVRVATVVIIIGAAVAAVQFVPANLFERLSTTGSEISGGTMNNRLRVWEGGLATVPERPLHGDGPAGWYPAVGFRLGNVAPHSTWLAILVEEGLIGLLLYLAILAVLLRRLLVQPTFERRVGLILLATLAVAITPLGWDMNKASWLVLALLAAFTQLAVMPAHGFADPKARSLRYQPASTRPGRRVHPVRAQ